MDSLDSLALKVLRAYPSILRLASPVFLGNRGGFSGASVWRISSAVGPLCLKAWPAFQPDLTPVHGLMRQAREAGLSCVPAVFLQSSGGTWIAVGGRQWDLCTWMPGVADYRDYPSAVRLGAACMVLARLHRAWEQSGIVDTGSCPAIQRRLSILERWTRPVLPAREEPLGGLASEAWSVVRPWLGVARDKLAAVQGAWALQPCLCDLWHDHVLFLGDVVSGVIDFGSVKIDTPAVDLARLLGSLVADDDSLWERGLEAYRRVRPVSEAEARLARLLDWTGVVVGLLNWLTWIAVERRPFADFEAVAARVGLLMERVRGWSAERLSG